MSCYKDLTSYPQRIARSHRSLLDLVRILEESSKDCGKCGPDLWNYAQQIRAGLLNELIRAELAGAGIRAEDRDAE